MAKTPKTTTTKPKKQKSVVNLVITLNQPTTKKRLAEFIKAQLYANVGPGFSESFPQNNVNMVTVRAVDFD